MHHETLSHVMTVAGVCQKAAGRFFTTTIPNIYYHIQYEDDDTPSFMSECPSGSLHLYGFSSLNYR